MDAILAELGQEFGEDDPRVGQLLRLTEEADENYRDQHEDYTDMELTLEVHLLVEVIRVAREMDLCISEFINRCMEAFVKMAIEQ